MTPEQNPGSEALTKFFEKLDGLATTKVETFWERTDRKSHFVEVERQRVQRTHRLNGPAEAHRRVFPSFSVVSGFFGHSEGFRARNVSSKNNLANSTKIFFYMDTQVHAILHFWIQFIHTSLYPRREKTIWSELDLNPGPLGSQATALTTRPWLLGQTTPSLAVFSRLRFPGLRVRAPLAKTDTWLQCQPQFCIFGLAHSKLVGPILSPLSKRPSIRREGIK